MKIALQITFKTGILLLLALVALQVTAQDSLIAKRSHRFPIWSFHTKNKTIDGISFGLASVPNKQRNVKTNGIKIELLGVGFFTSMVPQSPIATSDTSYLDFMNAPLSETVNGISLSVFGTAADEKVNGITLGLWGEYLTQINGVGAVCFVNFVQKVNGVQAAFLMNDCYELHGLQIGLLNRTQRLKGFQIGLWNVNSKRKLPLINWSFEE
ncbi:MAG: hypothetical protein IT221_06355 [Fluviicola sp.]|nr:hypothetical protein [Fluviicola sp.]